MLGTAWLRALIALPFVAGCTGDGEQERPEASQAEIYCEAMCARDAECSGYVSNCKSYCISRSGNLGNFRHDYVASASACIRNIDCASFYFSDSFVPCWEQAANDVEPTRGVRAFCEPWCTRWFECGYSCNVSECERGWAFLTDGFLEHMLECTEEPCETLQACQTRTEEEL